MENCIIKSSLGEMRTIPNKFKFNKVIKPEPNEPKESRCSC